MNDVRRFAVNRLHLPDGRVLPNRIVEVRDGRVVAHFPLVEELPAVEWRGGDFYLDTPAV